MVTAASVRSPALSYVVEPWMDRALDPAGMLNRGTALLLNPPQAWHTIFLAQWTVPTLERVLPAKLKVQLPTSLPRAHVQVTLKLCTRQEMRAVVARKWCSLTSRGQYAPDASKASQSSGTLSWSGPTDMSDKQPKPHARRPLTLLLRCCQKLSMSRANDDKACFESRCKWTQERDDQCLRLRKFCERSWGSSSLRVSPF